MECSENVGKRIRKIRNDLGLTMAEFASRIDGKAGSGTVNNWERNLNMPNRKRTKRIAEIGDMTVNELLGTNSNKTVEEEINDIKNNFSDEEIKEIIRKLI